MTLGLPERIESKISPEPNSGCWLWTGYLHDNRFGYGELYWECKRWRTHNLVYTLLVSPIPKGLELDHLCRNKFCCNPQHLEPVTHKVNIHRGEAPSKHHALKTHCAQGHSFSEHGYQYRGKRVCRPCAKAAMRRYRSKRDG